MFECTYSASGNYECKQIDSNYINLNKQNKQIKCSQSNIEKMHTISPPYNKTLGMCGGYSSNTCMCKQHDIEKLQNINTKAPACTDMGIGMCEEEYKEELENNLKSDILLNTYSILNGITNQPSLGFMKNFDTTDTLNQTLLTFNKNDFYIELPGCNHSGSITSLQYEIQVRLLDIKSDPNLPTIQLLLRVNNNDIIITDPVQINTTMILSYDDTYSKHLTMPYKLNSKDNFSLIIKLNNNTEHIIGIDMINIAINLKQSIDKQKIGKSCKS